jgi:homoserine/homoserine lactone efflux protein
LFIDGCFLLSYGKFADYLSKKYRHQLANKLNKVSGSFFIGAALLLGLKDIDI